MSTPLNGKLVTIFGGSGFLGRHIVQSLARRGYRIRAAVRRPDLATHLQPLGAPGQIMAVQANLRYRWSLARAVTRLAAGGIDGVYAAADTIADVEASGLWPGKVVTEVAHVGPFWEAEPEHQDYLERITNGYTCHYPRPNWVLPKRAAAE